MCSVTQPLPLQPQTLPLVMTNPLNHSLILFAETYCLYTSAGVELNKNVVDFKSVVEKNRQALFQHSLMI